MDKKERLDKILSNMGYGSRKQIKAKIKSGLVKVDKKVIKSNSHKVNPYESLIEFKDEKVEYREYIYIMMNKPAGVVSATEDNIHKTVIDLLENKYQIFNPFPVGRLDKDTEGFLLLTNDGQLAHNLLSPKKHVNKIYYVEVEGELKENDKESFERGIDIGEEKITMPAKLDIIDSGSTSKGYVTIREGKYHQIKRMFKALGKQVVYLKRISMGEITLDKDLKLGDYRELNQTELDMLKR